MRYSSLALAVLVAATPAFSTEFWVSSATGDDANDGSAGHPWATLQKAVLAAVPDAAATIHVYPGAYTEPQYGFLNINRDGLDISFEADDGLAVMDTANSTQSVYLGPYNGSISFKNFSFPATCSVPINHLGNQNLSLIGCILASTSSNVGIYLQELTTSSTRQLTIDRCTVSCQYSPISVFGAKSVTIQNSDICCTGRYSAIYLKGAISLVSIIGNNFGAPFNWAVDASAATRLSGCEEFVFSKNTTGRIAAALGGLNITDGVSNLRVMDNNLILYGEGNLGTGRDGLHLGLQDDIDGYSSILHAVVARNFVKYTGPRNCHAYRFGANLLSGEAYDNVGMGGDYQFVFKCRNVYAHDNIMIGRNPVNLGDGGFNKICFNTFVAINTTGVAWTVNNDGDAAVQNTICNNILIVSADATKSALCDSRNNHRNNRIDSNCYYGLGGAHICYLNNQFYDDLTDIQNKWMSYSRLWPDNDANSFIGDPQMANFSAILNAENYWPDLPNWASVKLAAKTNSSRWGAPCDITTEQFSKTDYDLNGVINHNDVLIFNQCRSGASIAYVAKCAAMDLDWDGDVDQSDFGIFQACLGGGRNGDGVSF